MKRIVLSVAKILKNSKSSVILIFYVFKTGLIDLIFALRNLDNYGNVAAFGNGRPARGERKNT